MTEDLKPCPFCGATGDMISVYYCDYAQRWKAGCGPCGTHVGITPRKENDSAAALTGRWNTRADQVPAATQQPEVVTVEEFHELALRYSLVESNNFKSFGEYIAYKFPNGLKVVG